MAGLLKQLPRPGMPGFGAPGDTRPFRVLAAALSALVCKFMMGKCLLVPCSLASSRALSKEREAADHLL